jgi:glycine oxidase
MKTKSEGGDAIVVGGGAVGSAIARALALRGLSVILVERNADATGATWAAAGMLAPLGEAGEPGAFLDLGLESLRLWPDFARAIEEESGSNLGFLRSGKLQIAFSAAEASTLEARRDWVARISPEVEWIEGNALRTLEPSVSPRARAGLLIPRDYQVDNRRLGDALRAAAERAGVTVREGVVRRVLTKNGAATGVELDGGSRIRSARVVLAAGCWSGGIGGLPRPLPVRPVRGQMLALDARDVPLTRIVATPDVYLVPRGDGTLLVGATVEEAGFRAVATAGGMLRLLEAAVRAAPLLEDAPVREAWAGLRPGTPDDLPILGEDPDVGGLFYATGHYRNGILLTPVTAALLTAMIVRDPPAVATAAAPAVAMERFRPDRFSEVRPEGHTSNPHRSRGK